MTTENLVKVPDVVTKQYRELTICADLFYINVLPFLTTISKNILFSTVVMLQNRYFDMLLDGILDLLVFNKVMQ